MASFLESIDILDLLDRSRHYVHDFDVLFCIADIPLVREALALVEKLLYFTSIDFLGKIIFGEIFFFFSIL